MVDLDQTERVDRELNVVKRARFNQTIKVDKLNEVPETKFGVEPHTVKELPALPVRERQQDNMFLHQQLQDNMLDEEVVSFGQRAQHQQDQQQLQLRQHNIPHNPVSPKQNECSNFKGHSTEFEDKTPSLFLTPHAPGIYFLVLCESKSTVQTPA